MMFRPLLLLLGIVSITFAQDHFEFDSYNLEPNYFGDNLANNAERSMDYMETGHEHQNSMISDYSDQNKGTIFILFFWFGFAD